MKTYINTFEIFGDPCPAECENEREYAEGLLTLFEQEQLTGGYYEVFEPMADLTGYSKEIEWRWRLWEAGKRIHEFDPDSRRRIKRSELLRFLCEAVEVKGEK
jgi:hypothetical protein